METLITANQERAYAVANTTEQGIYAINNNLVIPASAAYAIKLRTFPSLFGERKVSPAAFARERESVNDSGTLIGYDNGIKLHQVIECHTTSIKTSCVSHRTNVNVTLGDPLERLVEFYRAHPQEALQFGFATKDGVKTLHAPGTVYGEAIPWNYRDGGNVSTFKNAVNQPYHPRLLEALGRADLKRARKTIDAFLDEDYCIIDRAMVTIGRVFSGPVGTPTITVPRRTPEEERKQDLLASNQERARIMINVRETGNARQNYECRQELADLLTKDYKLPCTALMTASTIVMTTDTNEAGRCMTHLQARRYQAAAVSSTRLSRMRLVALPKPKTRTQRRQGQLSHVALLNAYAAHRITTGEGIVGAVMDTGVDYTHEALAANFGTDKGYDFVRDTTDPMDLEGHGTHVAGIWASVAPGVRLKAVRVLDEWGRGNEADILLGYEYCYRNQIPIINCSFGSPFASEEERQVVEAAPSCGCMIVAAAGNDSSGERDEDIPSYPAVFSGVQSIGSVNPDRKHSSFSNMGFVSFSAQGEDVLSTLPDDSYGTMDGTSMASPSVAGALTLQLAANPRSLEDRLMIAHARCFTEFGKAYPENEWTRRFGYGIPDCLRLVER
ncbi:S8 family serine peptidase [Candidatus Woesearchaeota archaeon]|nr:S8 family serine peptidase [Candidatus Woesearchaeota archaeon]